MLPISGGGAAIAADLAVVGLVLMLSLVEAAGGSAPIPSGSCSDGYYRNGTVIFNCGAQSGAAYLLLGGAGGGGEAAAAGLHVPAGVRDLRLSVAAVEEISVVIHDRTTGEAIISSTDGDASADWRGARITCNRTLDVSLHTWNVTMSVVGVVPDTLNLEARTAEVAVVPSIANITYSYAEIVNCPLVPAGCADFARYKARDLVFNWSGWAESQYRNGDDAWGDLCNATMESVSGLAPGPVPYYMWEAVWSKWPAAAWMKPGWQEAFRFLDELAGTPPNGYVDPEEFETAFGLAGVFLSMFTWCETVRKTHPDHLTAWAAVAGSNVDGLNHSQWENKVWNPYEPPDGFDKVSADESFVYTDADSDGMVSQKEFYNVFDKCRPSRTGGFTAANTTTTTSAVAVAGSGALGGGQLDSAAPATPPGHGEQSLMVASVDARGNLSSGTNCLYEGVAYFGPVGESNPSVEASSATCQERCAKTPGCGRFTFQRGSGKCELFNSSAGWRHAEDVISGPPLCIAEVRLQIIGVNLGLLAESQRADLSRMLAEDVSQATDLPTDLVRDGTGGAGRVTLQTSAGSTLAFCFIDLPPGSTIASLTRRLSDALLRQHVVGSLSKLRAASANKDGWEVGEQALERLAVAAEAEALPGPQCYLLGTRYEPNMVVEQLMVHNLTDCQARCARTPQCAHFTFFRDSLGCFLQEAFAAAARDANATAGPAVCQPLPQVAEPDDTKLEGEFGHGLGWLMVLLLLVWLVCCVALSRVLWPHLKQCWARLRAPHSAGKQPKYQPLSAEVPASDHLGTHRLKTDTDGFHAQHPGKPPLPWPSSAGAPGKPPKPFRAGDRLPGPPGSGRYRAPSWNGAGHGAGVPERLGSPRRQSLRPDGDQPARPPWMPQFLGPEDARCGVSSDAPPPTQQTLGFTTLPPNFLLPDDRAPVLVAPLAAPPVCSVPAPPTLLPPPLGSGIGAPAEYVEPAGLSPLVSLELANNAFDLIDRNHDGVITWEEWQQLQNAQHVAGFANASMPGQPLSEAPFAPLGAPAHFGPHYPYT